MTTSEHIETTNPFRIRNALLTITRCWTHMLPRSPAATITGTIGRHPTQSRPPVPVHILDTRSLTLSRLTGWALVVLDDRNLHTPIDAHDVHALAKLLSTHADWLGQHEAAQNVLTELEDCARRCQSIAEPFAPQKFAGICDKCAGDLMGDGKIVRCKGCDTVVDGQTQRLKVAAAVKNSLMTAAEIVTISPHLGHRVTHVQVSRWAARGLLTHRGTTAGGRALYSVAEVCGLLEAKFGQVS